MKTTPTTEVTPVNGVLRVAGLIQSPHQRVLIRWEVDGASGCTTCEAWQGQSEIEGLTRAGHVVKGVSLAE